MSRPKMSNAISDLRHRIYTVAPGDPMPEQNAVFISKWATPGLDDKGRPRSRRADLRCLTCNTEYNRTYEAIVKSVERDAISCPECRKIRLSERHWMRELKNREDKPIIPPKATRPCVASDVRYSETERLAHCKPWR